MSLYFFLLVSRTLISVTPNECTLAPSVSHIASLPWPLTQTHVTFFLYFLPPSTRCVFHRHAVVPVEGDRHHAGQLPAALHPEVPAPSILPTQLLQAHLIEEQEHPPSPTHPPARQPPSSPPGLFTPGGRDRGGFHLSAPTRACASMGGRGGGAEAGCPPAPSCIYLFINVLLFIATWTDPSGGALVRKGNVEMKGKVCWWWWW